MTRGAMVQYLQVRRLKHVQLDFPQRKLKQDNLPRLCSYHLYLAVGARQGFPGVIRAGVRNWIAGYCPSIDSFQIM
jgi:hypothetical protein